MDDNKKRSKWENKSIANKRGYFDRSVLFVADQRVGKYSKWWSGLVSLIIRPQNGVAKLVNYIYIDVEIKSKKIQRYLFSFPVEKYALECP